MALSICQKTGFITFWNIIIFWHNPYGLTVDVKPSDTSFLCNLVEKRVKESAASAAGVQQRFNARNVARSDAAGQP